MRQTAIIIFLVALGAGCSAGGAPEETVFVPCDGGACADTAAEVGDTSSAADLERSDVRDGGARAPLVEPDYSSDPVVAMCEKVVFLLVDCLEYHCSVASPSVQRERFREEMLDGTATVDSCPQRAEADPDFRAWLEGVANWSCNEGDWRAYQCGPGDNFYACDCEAPSNLGAVCASEADCDSGDLTAICTPSRNSAYCYAEHCAVPDDAELFDSYYDDRCGPGNVCSAQPAEWVDTNGNLYPDAGEFAGLEGLCAAGCESQADCLPERACQPLHFEADAFRSTAVRWCHYRCQGDYECAGGFRCDAGVCQFPCNSASGTSYRDFCRGTGGTCVDDPQRGTDYCVWD